MSHAVSHAWAPCRSPPVATQKIVSRYKLMPRALCVVSQRAGPCRPRCYAPQHTPRLAAHLAMLAQPCLPSPVSRYNLLYRDPAPKMGSSPFQLPCTFLFFFFICSTHCKTTKKKNSIFSIEQKKIIIIFFPVLHTVKPQKKKFSQYIYFFIPPVASLLLLRCSTLNKCYSYNLKFLRVELQPLFLVQKLE